MELKEVKQRFFAMRNGMLADALRKQCALPHRMIFGLNLPQLKEIAADCGTDAALADALWADADVRESRLLAPMVSPVDDRRLDWLREVRSTEEADILCHSLLRRCPGAMRGAVDTLGLMEHPLLVYAGLRLLLNLWPVSEPVLRRRIHEFPPHPLTNGIVRQIKEELDYYVDDL